ncbi:MAG: S8 family serine peptidase [Nocardioides sp.]
MRRLLGPPLLAFGGLVGVVLVGVALVGVPAAGVSPVLVDTDCAMVQVDDQAVDSTSPSLPFDSLGMEDAWAPFVRRGQVPGIGVRVAVVDSGVSVDAQVSVVERVSFSTGTELGEYHGTAVAGLIAGRLRAAPEMLPVGFAPGAEIVDVRVYDRTQPDEGEVGIETPRVAAGLRWVADNAQRLGIGVANVSLAVAPSDELAAAVRAVGEADVVVVAGSGNRPVEGDPLFAQFGEVKNGEDAVASVFPAGYGAVVAVSSTADGIPTTEGEVDVRGSVLQNSATDVAAPSYGAVTTSVSGGTCVLPSVATSWAAAEVSGVVALMRATFPDDNARQIVTRLRATADGTASNPTVLTGAGVVQPSEALSRPLRPGRGGEVVTNAEEEDTNPRATAPVPPADRLAQTRRNAVWLGLLGGSALAIAALLRPLLRSTRKTGGG